MGVPWRPRRFRTELLLVFLGLFIVVQTAGFLITRAASERNARAQVAESLEVAGGALERVLADRDQHLLEAGGLLAADFAFKSAFATMDTPTILSMLGNHRFRIEADVMMLIDLDEHVIADTLHPEATGTEFSHSWLLDDALEDPFGQTTGLVFVDGRPMRFIVLPLFTPLHAAWIAIGFRIDDEFTESLKSFAMADMSLVGVDRGTVSIFASTLAEDERVLLARALPETQPAESFEVELNRRAYQSLAIPLRTEGDASVYALMQRPLDAVLAPYRELQAILAGLFVLGLLATAVGAAALAGGVARPLAALREGARRISQGDYEQKVALDRCDELGELAGAFNEMAYGLADRDRVRNLLGKVVSPQIAEQLLSKEIALGGEEVEATILFADCRGFTTLSEQLPPTEMLERLNELLTALTEVIERHGGVVDKYMGDNVMALFGAPLTHPDDPSRAVACALDMLDAAAALNAHYAANRRLDIGIGVNTGPVVAGNMGSITRLNYTVIGDAVNLAARIESLTRTYGVGALVSEYTRAKVGEACGWREVDRVQVKGRSAPVAVFEPTRPNGS